MTHFCVNCGTALDSRVIEGRPLEACSTCDFVLWRDPKVVTMVVAEAAGKVVMGRRAIEPGYGYWCLPGGFVKDDEHPTEAAARECLEEIGARIQVQSLVGVYHIRKEGAPSMIGIAYGARILDPKELRAGDEMLEIGTFPPDQVPQLAFPSHTWALEDWARERASARPPAPAPARPALARGSSVRRGRRPPGRSRPDRSP